MPLNTMIIREGQELHLRWGAFHVAAMVIASALDSGKGPWKDNTVEELFGEDTDYGPGKEIPLSPVSVWALATSYPAIGATPMGHDGYVLTKAWTFRDVTDGEVLELLPGDRLIAYRARGW